MTSIYPNLKVFSGMSRAQIVMIIGARSKLFGSPLCKCFILLIRSLPANIILLRIEDSVVNSMFPDVSLAAIRSMSTTAFLQSLLRVCNYVRQKILSVVFHCVHFLFLLSFQQPSFPSIYRPN